MIYYAGWLYLVVISLAVSVAAVIWGLRNGQFSDQERARFLPLGKELLKQPIETVSRAKSRALSTVILIIFAIGLAAFATALTLSIHYR